MDILGIDIGTVSVKYVRYRKKGKGVVVSRGEYPYKEGWEDLEGILSSIKSREGVNVEVAIGITSQEILKKTFTVPVIPKEELREVLDWSAHPLATVEVARVMDTDAATALKALEASGAVEADGYWSLRDQDQLAAGAATADRLVGSASVG